MNKYLLDQYKKRALDLGLDLKIILVDEIQAFFLEEFYKNPASYGLALFGGGRFRHLDNSIRLSLDLDFFKTAEFNLIKITDFISNNFIKSLRNKFAISARLIDIPPWEKIHGIETIRLFIYDVDADFHQLEIDLDFIMREPYDVCEKMLLKNTIIIAGSSGEIMEEKLISVYERQTLKTRDIFDFWYFREFSKNMKKENIQKKLKQRMITEESMLNRLKDFELHKNYYLKELENIIKSCGTKRPEVNNLLQLDTNVILDYTIKMTKEYLS